jgi:hypothetical protein
MLICRSHIILSISYKAKAKAKAKATLLSPLKHRDILLVAEHAKLIKKKQK